MNTRTFFSLCFVFFLLSSCSKDATVVNELDAEISSVSKTAATTHDILCSLDEAQVIAPCTINPLEYPETPFPVLVLLNGAMLTLTDYSFEWSTGSNEESIYLTYNDLPVSLVVTENNSNCQVLLTLDESRWGKDAGISAVSVCHLPTGTALPEGTEKGNIGGKEMSGVD